MSETTDFTDFNKLAFSLDVIHILEAYKLAIVLAFSSEKLLESCLSKFISLYIL
jgi:hypothetical protein